MGQDLDIPAREARELLRANGHQVGARGPLSKSELELLEEIRRADPAGDDGQDVTAAGSPPGPPAGTDPVMAENTPRAAPSKPSRGGQRRAALPGARLFSRRQKKPRARRPAVEQPWVSTAGVVEQVLSQMAHAARKIPPLQKVLYAEAAMAGPVVERTARGTRVDKVMLQPLARNWERFEVADALIGVPAATTMIALFGGAVMAPDGSGPLIDGETGLPVFDQRTEAMVVGLRFSLRSWLKISRRHAEEIIESAEETAELDDQVDKMVAWILAPPEPGQTRKELKAEAAQFAAGQDDPAQPGSQQDMTGRLEGMARSTAFAPAPATGSKG
jgi:hypothetical protein